MKYAIVSDVHANLTALRRVLEHARERGVERVICLGDVVGYGPEPAEALSLVRQTCAACLAGNHDDAVSGRLDAADFIDLAGDAVARHRQALSEADLGWLRSLTYVCSDGTFAATHGDFVDPPKFYYVENEEDARLNFEARPEQLLFVGHTHVSALFVTGHSGKVYRTEVQDFTLESGKRYLVNPGSVGYPREANGICLSSYVIYDSTEGTVNFRTVPFEMSSLLQRGRATRGLPRRLALLLTLVLALGLGGAFGYAALARRAADRRAAAAVASAAASVQAARPLAVRELALSPAVEKVSAGFRLEKDSPGANLRLEFFNAAGKLLVKNEKHVSKSNAAFVKTPPGASRAVYSVFVAREGETPRWVEFAPRCQFR